MSKNTDKNNLIVINLDRPRFVKFGHKALKQLGTLDRQKARGNGRE